MKKYHLLPGLFLIGALIHLTSIDCGSSFLIGLTNGRRIYVEAYQIKGEEMTLYFKNGLLRISKHEVKSILEEKDEPFRNEEISTQEKEAKEALRNPNGNMNATASIKKAVDIESYRKKKTEISDQLEEAKKYYFEASNKFDKERARRIMLSISKQLFSLEEEVTKGNGGIVPAWWK